VCRGRSRQFCSAGTCSAWEKHRGGSFARKPSCFSLRSCNGWSSIILGICARGQACASDTLACCRSWVQTFVAGSAQLQRGILRTAPNSRSQTTDGIYEPVTIPCRFAKVIWCSTGLAASTAAQVFTFSDGCCNSVYSLIRHLSMPSCILFNLCDV
jgi:hypothetical protein